MKSKLLSIKEIQVLRFMIILGMIAIGGIMYDLIKVSADLFIIGYLGMYQLVFVFFIFMTTRATNKERNSTIGDMFPATKSKERE